MAALRNTSFKNVQFEECKFLGIVFRECNPFLLSMNFKGCLLNLADLSGLPLKGIHFENCSLQEVDFSETDLNQSVFKECDLERAIFDNTNLAEADFSTAYHFTIDPAKNSIRKAKFATDGLAGLLVQYGIEVV